MRGGLSLPGGLVCRVTCIIIRLQLLTPWVARCPCDRHGVSWVSFLGGGSCVGSGSGSPPPFPSIRKILWSGSWCVSGCWVCPCLGWRSSDRCLQGGVCGGLGPLGWCVGSLCSLPAGGARWGGVRGGVRGDGRGTGWSRDPLVSPYLPNPLVLPPVVLLLDVLPHLHSEPGEPAPPPLSLGVQDKVIVSCLYFNGLCHKSL